MKIDLNKIVNDLENNKNINLSELKRVLADSEEAKCDLGNPSESIKVINTPQSNFLIYNDCGLVKITQDYRTAFAL